MRLPLGGDQHGLVTLACTEFNFASSLSFLESLPGVILWFIGEYTLATRQINYIYPNTET